MTRARGRGRRGYTVIEVMIALTLLAVGTSGVIAMQKVTAIANRDARCLVVATQIARSWIERLRADATQWNHPSAIDVNSDLADTRWLKSVSGVWFRPTDDLAGSPALENLGQEGNEVMNVWQKMDDGEIGRASCRERVSLNV